MRLLGIRVARLQVHITHHGRAAIMAIIVTQPTDEELRADIEANKKRPSDEAKAIILERAKQWNKLNREKIGETLTTRRIENKLRAIEYLGSMCMHCKQTYPMECYDFHHRDHTTKSFSLATRWTRAWDVIQAELDKCDLLCANCHRIVTHS
jgi:hypothetical protein